MTDVFIGFLYDEAMEAQLLATSKSGVSSASNQYQKGFLSGLSQPVQILTTLSVGAFPRSNRKLFFPRSTAETDQGPITYLPFWNLHGIKQWQFRAGLYRSLSAIIKSQPHTTVYAYSLYTPALTVLHRLKRTYGSRLSLCLIIPDLPGKYGLIRKGIKGLKDRGEAGKKMRLANDADSFVFLTEAMKDLFDPKPSTVIEGFLPTCSFDYTQPRIPKSVLYTGSLNRAYGFGNLLEAFSRIPDPEAQLWICGAGDMEEAVKVAAKKDPRIQFKGFLPKQEIAALQTRCDVLINPRTDEGEYTKYSFPSKTMEYLLSGSKVVMYRLSGIPEAYYTYIRTIDAPTPASMAEALQAAWADRDFYHGASQAQVDWIQNNKSAAAQLSPLPIIHQNPSQ